MTSETLQLRSPAKVNLRLEVLKKRPDGYHEIRTLLQQISLYDRLRFTLRLRGGIRIHSSHPDLPRDRRNLVYRAAEMILAESGYKGGVDIEIDKRIPLGAGLGGGSSNAAVTLKGLNRILKLGLSRTELEGIGVRVGADVPFFISRGAAIGTGIGEKLTRIRLPLLYFVLLNPGFEISTRWAYENCVLTRRRFHYNIQPFLENPRQIFHILWNDLEEVASKKYPEISVMKKAVLAVGARGALMTGSGPTVFGLFEEREAAASAYRKLLERAKEEGWTVLAAHSIVA